jgi:hypothetical protein
MRLIPFAILCGCASRVSENDGLASTAREQPSSISPSVDQSPSANTPRPVNVPKSGIVRVIDDSDKSEKNIHTKQDLKVLFDCIRRSQRVGNTLTIRPKYSHWLALEESWGYDKTNGFLATHTRFVSDVYRIRKDDRQRFEKLLKR